MVRLCCSLPHFKGAFPLGNARNMVFWVVLFLMVLALFNLFSSPQGTANSQVRSYSDFVVAVDAGSVTDVVIDGETISFAEGGRAYTTIMPRDAEITNLLIDAGVPVEARSQETSALQSFLVGLLPFILLKLTLVFNGRVILK